MQKRKRMFLGSLGGFLAICGTARAGVIDVTDFGGGYKGPKFVNAFVAQGRIGDSARRPGNRTHEVNLSKAVSGAFAKGEKSNHVWKSGEVVPFALIYDGVKTVTFSIGQTTVQHLTPADSSIMNGILFKARSAKAPSSIVVDDLELDGQSVSGNLSASGDNHALLLKTDMLTDGFVLTGTLRMDFPAGKSASLTHSQLSVQIAVGHVAPEPATLLLMALVPAIWRGSRHSHRAVWQVGGARLRL